MYACLHHSLDFIAYAHTLVIARMHTVTLRDARRRRKWDQVDLAKASGIDQSTISRLELRRTKRAHKDTVDALEKALGLKPGMLDIPRIEASEAVAS